MLPSRHISVRKWPVPTVLSVKTEISDANNCLSQTFFVYSITNQSTQYSIASGLGGSVTYRFTGVMRSPPARRSRSPYYRSAGHRLFRLCMTLSRGRGWSNGFEWDSNLVRCLLLVSWMTLCTVVILRSLSIISLVTYRGMSAVALNILDWHLCMTAILDLQAQPHNSMPYVRLVVIMDLYSRSLLSTERWDVLPSNQTEFFVS